MARQQLAAHPELFDRSGAPNIQGGMMPPAPSPPPALAGTFGPRVEQAAPITNVPTVSSAVEYAALPSGALYRDSRDGKIHRKQ